MPSPRRKPGGADPRTPEARALDHATIDRLAEDLVPAIAAKLGATGLAEIEVHEGGWRLRVRRPPAAENLGRRAGDRPSRSQPGHAGHGHAPGALEGHRAVRPPGAAAHSTNGASPPASPVASQRTAEPADGRRRRGDPDAHRAIATSPAVGVYQARAEMAAGTRVRAGDRLGVVDMLGVPQDVVAPADGVVGASLAESGEAVEYGQELVVVELTTSPVAGSASGGAPGGGRGRAAADDAAGSR